MHEELLRRGTDLELIWAVKDHSVELPDKAVPVLQQSEAWVEALRNSRYVIDNMHQPAFFEKADGQVLIETFHGYPFKSMGHPHWERMKFSKARMDSLDARAAQWDFLVSPAPYATPLLKRDFRYDGEVLEIGYPRNDVLLSPDAGTLREQTRRRLGLPDGVTAVLYAPTFRDNLSQDDFRAPMVDYLDVASVIDALGDDHVILVRGHAFNARMPTRLERRRAVIDVTDYPDVSHLYLASDALVADYSSLRFDYALTDKPMIFLVPDLEEYRDQSRGWLFDFEVSAPGPHVASTDEVIEYLGDPDRLRDEFRTEYKQFHRDFHPLEDGRATHRLVDAVFGSRGDA
jgi:CDP-glycerol glycerophosphotransferase